MNGLNHKFSRTLPVRLRESVRDRPYLYLNGKMTNQKVSRFLAFCWANWKAGRQWRQKFIWQKYLFDWVGRPSSEWRFAARALVTRASCDWPRGEKRFHWANVQAAHTEGTSLQCHWAHFQRAFFDTEFDRNSTFPTKLYQRTKHRTRSHNAPAEVPRVRSTET